MAHSMPAASDTQPPSPRDLDVRPIDKEDAKAIVLPNHYSGTWNTLFGRINFGIFDGHELCGAAVFGYPMNPASAEGLADIPGSHVLELNRLWIDDRFGHNTESAMLSRCHKWLRANTDAQLIQSFADGRLGCGTIYKAANYGYYGKTRTLFFRHHKTGEILHGTAFSNTAKTDTMILRNAMWVDGLLVPFEAYTYRYLYPLTRHARRTIRIPQQPYPPYDKGEIPLPDYQHPLPLIARCYAISEAKGDAVRAERFLTYLASEASPEQFDKLLEDADENEWVAQIVAEAHAQPSLFDGIGAA